MSRRALFFMTFALSAGLLMAAEETYKLSEAKGAPEGLARGIQSFLNPQGYEVAGPDGPLVRVWLAKNLLTKSGFQPTLSVKYPFEVGALIGALQVPEGASFTDFRGQDIPPGVYTLRYAQQPMDGNHLGTSETQDFLLAVPAAMDKDPLPFRFTKELHEKSAEAAGATHPAIFSLLPTEGDGGKTPSLTHNEERDFWILNITGASKEGGKETKVPMRVVVVGQSEV